MGPHRSPTLLAGAIPSGDSSSVASRQQKTRCLVFLLTLPSLFLAGAFPSGDSSTSHAYLHDACGSARYTDLCVSSISSSPSLMRSLSSPKDVIHASLNLTGASVHLSVSGVRKLSLLANLTGRERTALRDCLEMFDETLDELRRADGDLRAYPSGDDGRSLARHAADLKILVSAAMTNQESCADGFSHASVDRRLRDAILSGLTHVEQMCSNSLGMIRNMTDADLAAAAAAAAAEAEGMNFKEKRDDGRFPEWMTAGDRRLLQAADVSPDVTVAVDGSGDYRTVSAAVAAAPAKSSRRYVIRIKAGTYEENVEVPKKKTNIMFWGDGRTKTIITGSRSVAGGWTTFRSATLAVVGDGFLARGLRIENTAGPAKHQAVALRVGSDLSAFYDCDIVGYQDTLYVHSLRQFFSRCLISGTVDFIFGNAAAVLQDCDIQPRRPGPGQKNMVTASGRSDPNEPTGIVLQSCRIEAAADLAAGKGSVESYLGRPWKEYARTVVMESAIGDVIHPAGWHVWNGEFALATLYYGEYRNSGPGAGTANRVKWKGYRVITDAGEAEKFTVGRFIEGANWLKSTGFPFSLGL